jgi:V/A-type H+-transporting ATPase subunit E
MAEEKKLDSLLERIYQDGVDKSSKKSEEILAKAQSEAEKIVADAKTKAESIIGDAQKNAEEVKRNTLTDVRMSSEQAVSALKQKIKDLVVTKTLDESLKEAFVNASFLESLILEIVKKWDLTSSEGNISIYFPEAKKSEIEKTISVSIKKSINNVVIDFDKKLANGFKIVPADGNYQLQFTNEDFVEFFKDYIKQKTEEILFNK